MQQKLHSDSLADQDTFDSFFKNPIAVFDIADLMDEFFLTKKFQKLFHLSVLFGIS